MDRIATSFCNPIANILQQIIASDQIDASHCYSGFVIIWQTFYKKIIASEKNRRIALLPLFCTHFAKIVQQIIASEKNRHIALLLFLCNPIANIVQKIIASEKIDKSYCDGCL